MRCVMKISINEKRHLSSKNQTFKNNPKKLDYGTIKNAQHAIKAWESLRWADYLDVHSDSLFSYNKKIRLENYSFLDKLVSSVDKNDFITVFCNFTGFPNLKLISEKMNKEFEKTLKYIDTRSNGYYKVIDYGYDPTCSLGQKKAFPGSDLDKGYVILENKGFSSETVNYFKGFLWDCLDQRLVSLNHPDTFPEVYTENQIEEELNSLNSYAKKVLSQPSVRPYGAAFGAVLGDILLGPLGVPIGMALLGYKNHTDYPKPEEYGETNPEIAAKFNIEVAKILPSFKKEPAKNFAFFVEIVKANYRRNPYGKNQNIFNKIFSSDFAKYSNVTQVDAWQKKINNGYMKTKLRNRMQLEKDFYKMTINDKYDLIKDVIKSSSNDQCDERFSHLFKNDVDIANRYKPLLDKLV